MALDGAKLICLSDEAAAAAGVSEATPTASTGDVTGDSADAAIVENAVIEAKGRKFTVGYYMNCDYVLDDPRAIGVHCEIQCDAFGRVTIHNMSETHPISVNEQIITIKRPLLDGSRIKILDRTFLWQFPKSVEATATSDNKEDDGYTASESKVSTPQKLGGVAEQAPNSCPDLKPHRKVDKRFTVHNFAYCINSDDEGNTSSELPSTTDSESTEEGTNSRESNKTEATANTSVQLTKIEPSKHGMLPTNNTSQDSDNGKTTVETLHSERRSVTPEPEPSAPTIASTPLIKLEDTPKMNLINCTQNKENKSTEKKRRLLSLCQHSDVVITSFSPRETGVRIEKSFAAVFKPVATCTATTPTSVYSTPKSMLSGYNDEGSRDFIDFSTPATSKKALGARLLAKNSSMHLIDLTTPNKFAPALQRSRIALKCNKTLPSDVKLSTTPVSFTKVKEKSEAEQDVRGLPVTPLMVASSSKSYTATPKTAESVISVDGSTDLSTVVIEISTEDSATPSTCSPTVQKSISSKSSQFTANPRQLPSTPLRTPQSLMKRAILTSAKKRDKIPLRTAPNSATPTRHPTSTPARNTNIEKNEATMSKVSTPNKRTVIGSPRYVAAAQRRNFSVSLNRSLGVEGSTSVTTRESPMKTSTPLHSRGTESRNATTSASHLSVTKRTSPLHGVCKSFRRKMLPSHIAKRRRTMVSPRRYSVSTSIGAQLVTKARKTLCTASTSNNRTVSRSYSLLTAAVSGQNDTTNSAETSSAAKKKENKEAVPDTAGNELKSEMSSDNNKNKVDDLNRTFTVDDSLEEIEATEEVKTQNVTFPSFRKDYVEQTEESMTRKQELSEIFSPEKTVSAGDSEAGLDIPVDVAETNVIVQHDKTEKISNEKMKCITTERISESFAEVVESNDKSEEANKERLEDQHVADESAETSSTISKATELTDFAQNLCSNKKCISKTDEQDSTKVSKDQVIETLDADEISSSGLVAQPDSNAPLSTEILHLEVTSKPAGESQGTAELLEEIEYVLNKSDELQQQMGKDVHNTSAPNEDVDELEAAIAENLGDKTVELQVVESTKISETTGGENTSNITKSSEHAARLEDYAIGAQYNAAVSSVSSSHSEFPTSKKMVSSAKTSMEEDMTSIGSNALSSLSEIASSELDASSMETEATSITSVTTRSEIDVPTIESSSVEKQVLSREKEATDNHPVISVETKEPANITTHPKMDKIEVDIKSTTGVTSTHLELVRAPTNTLIEPDSTIGVKQETRIMTIENRQNKNASNEVICETKNTSRGEREEEDITLSKLSESHKDSQNTPVEENEVDDATTVDEEKKIDEERKIGEEKQKLLETDKGLQIIADGCEHKSSVNHVQSSTELEEASHSEKISVEIATDKSFVTNPKSDPLEPKETIEKITFEPEVTSTELEQPRASLPSNVIDTNEERKTNAQPEQAATTTVESESTSSDAEKTESKVEEPVSKSRDEEIETGDGNQKPGNASNDDEKKENKTIITITGEDKMPTSIAADIRTSDLEPKTPNLRGVREMLRTPKHFENSTPCFIGLRNLIHTPLASTSAAAAAAAIEEDNDELSGVQTLLKTPRHNKKQIETPQHLIESRFTPRRSTRRRFSANAELTPTRCVTPMSENMDNIDTPRRTTRRRASASAEVNYTPQRITRRRSSIMLDNEEIAAVLTPKKRVGLHAKRIVLLAECPVAEDMGAIIEEELKEDVKESSDAQKHSAESKKDSGSETTVPNITAVIEESICEEVSTQKQQIDEQKVSEEEVNAESKAIKPVGLPEELNQSVQNAETAIESTTEPSFTQLKKNEKYADDNSTNVRDDVKAMPTTEIIEELAPETEGAAAEKSDKSAKILDESDYEYGKEVKEEVEATDDNDLPPKTPRKSVRSIDASTKSPNTPIILGERELLKTPEASADTPRNLAHTPKANITSDAIHFDGDEEQLFGLVNLVKTPKAASITEEKDDEEVCCAAEEPSTSTAARNAYIGMRELLKSPKHTSTPQYRGMREMLRTPKACTTLQLGGIEELMQTPKRSVLLAQYDDENVELDQFFRTPRAKDVMIPAEPASAILEPSSDSMVDIMTATTEYDLHSSSQRPLEDIYKTPVSTRLTDVDTISDDDEEGEKKKSEEVDKMPFTTTKSDGEIVVPETPASNIATTKINLSAEEAFGELIGERTTLDYTTPQKVYARKRLSVAVTGTAPSPFSSTDVISDLPKTDIQEWVDRLEQGAEPEEEDERELTITASLLEASKVTHDPIAASVCGTSSFSVNADTTEELLADMSAVSSTVDPLLPSAAKSTKSVVTAAVDDNETLRPTTPIESEISGINLLDQTNESVFSEPLAVSDSDSVQDKQEKENSCVKPTETSSEIAEVDANKSLAEEEFPTMCVESSDSEPEEDKNTIKAASSASSTKPGGITNSAGSAIPTDAVDEETVKSINHTPDTEITDLDGSTTSESIESTAITNPNAEKTSITTDILSEFSNFQAHKTISSQRMRASTPNRSSKVGKPQYTPGRRQSMGAEQQLASVSMTLEKSRLTREKESIPVRSDNCIIEVDEEYTNESANVAEETAEMAENAPEKMNKIQNNKVSVLSTTEDNHNEFSNVQEHETIACRGIRAATPDQVNKMRTHKISQARRLTLGAEQHLTDVSIDFMEEKTKLKQSKQQPADECIQEIEDSVNASNVTGAEEALAEAPRNDVDTSDSTVEVAKSTGEPKEETLKSSKGGVNVENEEKVEEEIVESTQLLEKAENTVELEEVEGEKAIGKTADESAEDVVHNIEAEIYSTGVANDPNYIKTIENDAVHSTTESNGDARTKLAEQKSDEPDSIKVEEIATGKPAIEEVLLLENENKSEMSPISESSIGKSTSGPCDNIPVVAEEAGPEKTLANKFNESDIFDLTDEPPPETSNTTQGVIFDLTYEPPPESSNTTQGVIFDLTDEPPPETSNTTQDVIFDLTEEDAFIEHHTEESSTQNSNFPAEQTEAVSAESTTQTNVGEVAEVTKMQQENNEVGAGEKENIDANESKSSEVPFETFGEKTSGAVVSSDEIGAESQRQVASAFENGAATPIIEQNIAEKERVELGSTAAGQQISANKENISDDRNDKEADKKIEEQDTAAIVETEKTPDEIVTAVQTSENETLILATTIQSKEVGEIPESNSKTSQAVLEVPKESSVVDSLEMEVPSAYNVTAIELETAGNISDADEIIVEGSADANRPEGESEILDNEAEPVMQLEDSVIELDSDVEEIVIKPIANTSSQIAKFSELCSTINEQKSTESISEKKEIVIGPEISATITAENEEEASEKPIPVNIGSGLLRKISTEQATSPPAAPTHVAAAVTKLVISEKLKTDEEEYKGMEESDHLSAEDRPPTDARISQKSHQGHTEIGEEEAEEGIQGELDEATSSDVKNHPAKRTSRESSQSKQAIEEKIERMSEPAFERKFLIEEPAPIVEELQSDKTINIVPEKETEVQELTETLVKAEKITEEEPCDPTDSATKRQPNTQDARKPSLSKKMVSEGKSEKIEQTTQKGELETEEADYEESPVLIDPEEKPQSAIETIPEEKQPEIPPERIPEVSTLPVSVAEENVEVADEDQTSSGAKQQTVKRRGRKPSRSKQTAEEDEKLIRKATIESETLVEEPLSATELKQKEVEHVEQVQDLKMSETPAENTSKLLAQKESVPLEENVEEVEQLYEDPSSDGKQQLAKRRGRKPSRSKQTAEEKKEPISKAIIENTSLIEEPELRDSEEPISESNTENKTLIEKSAPIGKLTTKTKTESQCLIKANYEICLSTAIKATNSAANKPVETDLPGTSAKSKIENTPTLLTMEETEIASEAHHSTTTQETKEASEENITSTLGFASEAEPIISADNHEEKHTQRSTRRTRKGSQSSQCSAQDEDHLPTTTTRRRGGRRRAETPIEGCVDEAISPDAPTGKRRRGHDKTTEGIPLEDIQESQINECETKTESQAPGAESEENTIFAVNFEEEKAQSRQEVEAKTDIDSIASKSSDNNEVESQQMGEVLALATTKLQSELKSEEISGKAPSTEILPIDTQIKSSTSKRRRGRRAAEKTEESVEKLAIPKNNTENTDEHQSDAEELAEETATATISAVDLVAEKIIDHKQPELAVPKRGRRKKTVSESSQTSSTVENTEPHIMSRRRRGRRPTTEESIVDTVLEVVKSSETNALLAEEAELSKEEDVALVTVAEAVKDDYIIKAEIGNKEHLAVEETSARALTRNKQAYKSTDIPEGSGETSKVTDELKIESKEDTPVVKLEEPIIKKATTTCRTRVNRRKKVEADEEHQNKTEETDVSHKVNEVAEAESESAVDSVGGRRGRRGAAAAATVAINEVSSAHKRGGLRGKNQQSKPQTAQPQENTKKEPVVEHHAETATEHDEELSAVEEKKPYNVVRKRRASTTAEAQPDQIEEAVEKTEAESSTKTMVKRARKRRESHHEETTTSSVAAESPSAPPTKQRTRRKRKDSLHNVDEAVLSAGGDEPPKKLPQSHKRRDSSLDSSIHEGAGVDGDTNAGGNISSSSTTPHRSRIVPRRAAAAQERNYDESSDAEAQVDLKRRIEKASLPKTSSSSIATVVASSKHRSPTVGGTPTVEVQPGAEITTKTSSTPILSTIITTSRGRQRKPTARVQQYLEEERAKAETPKKRLLLGGETPTSQSRTTPATRTRKTSATETEVTEMANTPARGRVRTAKALDVTSEESRSELEHPHSELDTTHSVSHVRGHVTTTAKVIKRPTRRGKQIPATPIPAETELSEAEQVISVTPVQVDHTGGSRGGRAAKAAASAALITDEPTNSHKKARVARTRRGAQVVTTEDEQHTDAETKEVRAEVGAPSIDIEKPSKKNRAAATGGRGGGGRRRNKQHDDEEDTNLPTSQHGLLEDSEASSSGGPQQQQQTLAVDADDEHEEDEEALRVEKEEEEENKPLAIVLGEKTVGRKRATSTRKATTAAIATDSPAPKRGRRRAGGNSAEKSDASHLDTAAGRAVSSRNRKVVRFDAATPSSAASAVMPVQVITENIPVTTEATAKRATRSRRK